MSANFYAYTGLWRPSHQECLLHSSMVADLRCTAGGAQCVERPPVACWEVADAVLGLHSLRGQPCQVSHIPPLNQVLQDAKVVLQQKGNRLDSAASDGVHGLQWCQSRAEETARALGRRLMTVVQTELESASSGQV